jgi:hypothetical protein
MRDLTETLRAMPPPVRTPTMTRTHSRTYSRTSTRPHTTRPTTPFDENTWRLVYGPSWHYTVERFSKKRPAAKRARQLAAKGETCRLQHLHQVSGIWLTVDTFPRGAGK